MTHTVFYEAYCLNYFAHGQSVCQYKTVDFCHVNLRGSRFRRSRAGHFKNRRKDVDHSRFFNKAFDNT